MSVSEGTKLTSVSIPVSGTTREQSGLVCFPYGEGIPSIPPHGNWSWPMLSSSSVWVLCGQNGQIIPGHMLTITLCDLQGTLHCSH